MATPVSKSSARTNSRHSKIPTARKEWLPPSNPKTSMAEDHWRRAFGQYGGRVRRCPEALLPGATGTLLQGSRVAGFALRVLSRAAVTLMPWPKGIPVAGAQGSHLLHVAIPLRPKAFYSGSRVAGNQCSIRHQRSVLWRDYCYFRGMCPWRERARKNLGVPSSNNLNFIAT